MVVTVTTGLPFDRYDRVGSRPPTPITVPSLFDSFTYRSSYATPSTVHESGNEGASESMASNDEIAPWDVRHIKREVSLISVGEERTMFCGSATVLDVMR